MGLLFVVAVFVVGWALMPLRSQPFQASGWIHRGTRDIENSPGDVRRVRMVNDLTQHHLRLGMSRSEVGKLLGMADVVDGASDMGPIDIYHLITPPSQWSHPTPAERWNYALWSSASNFRYNTNEPTLRLTYQGFGDQNAPLVDITVK